jgi:endonuclease-3
MPRESLTIKKKRAAEIVARLKERYPEAECALQYNGEPWRLLVMGRLSAQCTDARVNLVCRDLFARFSTPEAMAYAKVEEIEDLVRPCGLYHTKARNIKDACRILVEDYGGIVPDDMDALLALPGVGRKIANLLLGDIYKKGGVVTDTHCIRICGRLGFYPETVKEPLKVERILTPLIVPEEQSDFCHRIVQFGRDTCMARGPRCEGCPLGELCPHGKVTE